MKTQGEIEAAISDGISRFEQEFMGRGPKDIRAHLIGDPNGHRGRSETRFIALDGIAKRRRALRRG